ncbi:anillin [Nematolebias whitei]|uniref:anillin n=1 Tax=Nematolebias whitei TaxID=451745 RepID=UPI00189AAB9C|nr:anillin [Nematolebias whitei]
MGFVPKPSARTKNSVTPDCKAVSSSQQESLHAPVKSSRVALPGRQKAEAPALESVHGAHKAAFPSASQESAVPPSPLKSPALSKDLHHIPSPQKPELQDKPTVSSSVAHQDKVPAAAPGAKSFLERFGERCQERKDHMTPNERLTSAKKTCVTPSVTPNTRLMQERLRAAHTANTTTAELTQRSRLERECELAQIRSGFQKGKSVWNVKDESAGTTMNNKVQKPVQSEVSQSEPAASTKNINTPPRCNSPI